MFSYGIWVNGYVGWNGITNKENGYGFEAAYPLKYIYVFGSMVLRICCCWGKQFNP
jgi:hypothetical protein